MNKKQLISILFLIGLLTVFAYAQENSTESKMPKIITNSNFQSIPNSKFASGMMAFWLLSDPTEYKAYIFIANNSNRPIDFKGAEYIAIGQDDTPYILEFEKVSYNDGVKHSQILNPKHTMNIHCNSPINPESTPIREVYIKLIDERKIHFITKENLSKRKVEK